LFGAPQGLYKAEIDPAAYLSVSRFIKLKASAVTEIEIVFPIDKKKVKSVVFQPFVRLPADLKRVLENSDKVSSFEGKKGEKLYDALDDIRKAGMLNIVAKCAATPLSNGKTILPFLERINEIRGDRFFVAVSKELRQETKNSAVAGLFFPAPEILHTPPEGFAHAGSFKTFDRYGNLQLSYFLNGEDCVADIDIDGASGLEHLFQVVEHRVTGQQTHPYEVHEILMIHQEIDPGYKFLV